MKNVNQTTRMLCEGAVSIALAYALTFVELDLWFQGGSISAAMIPIILFLSLIHISKPTRLID